MDEQLRILKMLEEGKITAEQASELMFALSPSEELPEKIDPLQDYDKKMFRIVVDSTTGDKVNVQLPVSAIRRILKVTGKIPAISNAVQGVDLVEIMDAVVECLDAQTIGDIINVTTSTGDTVKIFIN